jgi:hypothetical protein
MPEWRDLIRQRLSGVPLAPPDELAIIEELAQHLDDCYRELRQGGLGEAEAVAESLREIDAEPLAAGLRDSLPRS